MWSIRVKWLSGTALRLVCGQVDRQPAYSRDLGRLLRFGDEWRGEETANDSPEERSPGNH